MATNIPLNPTLTFKHISVHMVHILARMAAKKAVQAQLRDQGVRVSLVPPREINERATTYLAQHPEVWREALARAHLIDDAEGQRKDRQKLRRAELARLRKPSVT
jgi:protein involved in temperature-dependent protein secretion